MAVKESSFRCIEADTEKEMGVHSASELTGLLEHYTITKGVPVALNLAAAPSINSTYTELTNPDNLRRVDWQKVHVVHLDDYVDLPNEHPNTFKSYLTEHFLSKAQIPACNIYLIKDLQSALSHDGQVSQEELAESYGKLMNGLVQSVRDGCGSYISLIGIGENGHVGFNEWNVDKWTDHWVVPAVIDGVSVKQQYFDYISHPNEAARYRSMADVPRNAVTVSMAGILESDHIICVVPGAHKAWAVNEARFGSLRDDVASTMLRMHKDCRLFITKDSAERLKRQPMARYDPEAVQSYRLTHKLSAVM